MPPEDYRQTLRSLETHYQEFLRNSQDSQNFHPDDRLQVERDYTVCTQKYELLLRGLEKGKARGPLRAVAPGHPDRLPFDLRLGLSLRWAPWVAWAAHPCPLSTDRSQEQCWRPLIPGSVWGGGRGTGGVAVQELHLPAEGHPPAARRLRVPHHTQNSFSA